jgi:hypothetical protein
VTETAYSPRADPPDSPTLLRGILAGGRVSFPAPGPRPPPMSPLPINPTNITAFLR